MEMLLSALGRVSFIRIVRQNGSHVRLTSEQAALMVRCGGYSGRLHHGGRLRYLREVDSRRSTEFRPCWRNSEAAVLQPYAVTGRYEA